MVWRPGAVLAGATLGPDVVRVEGVESVTAQSRTRWPGRRWSGSVSRGVPGRLVGDGVPVPSTHLALNILGFLVALTVTLAAAAVFASWLDRLGARLGFTEALLGVLTAIAADSPELAASVAAILRGERDLGLGVVIGSNAFNLAAMVGLGAIVAGSVRPRCSSLVIEAAVALALLGVTAALLVAGLPPLVALAMVLVVVIPYVALLLLGDVRIGLLPLPARVHSGLRDALGGGFSHPRAMPHTGSLLKAIAPMALALAAIIVGAAAMVDTSVVIADAIGLSHALVGLLVLAVVTSLPNMSTALRLARQGRGDATVSETLNSNNINLVGGIILPSAILGLGTVPGSTAADVAWLSVLTVGTILALATRGGFGRLAGIGLVGGYLAFVLAHVI